MCSMNRCVQIGPKFPSHQAHSWQQGGSLVSNNQWKFYTVVNMHTNGEAIIRQESELVIRYI